MSRSFSSFAKIEFAPPQFLSLPTAGIDVSTSGVKVVFLKETHQGIVLDRFSDEPLPLGTIDNSEIVDREALAKALAMQVKKLGLARANITLSESRGYLFEAETEGPSPVSWCTQVEQHIDEYIPLPSNDVVFDIVPFSHVDERTHVIGIGYPRRVVANALAAFEDSGITVRAIEAETFALPRALLKRGDTSTVLIVDIGKTSTKLLIASSRLPRFATTLEVGGHAITLAAQKHFVATEEDAKKIKSQYGLVGGEGVEGGEAYQAVVTETISVIRDEIIRRLDYWQSRQTIIEGYAPVTRILLVGGNATLRGLPEFLTASLSIPVERADVFANFASREGWMPPIDFAESLTYGTAIGLALREYES